MIKRNGRLFIDRGLTSSVPGADIDKASEIIIRDPKTGDIKNTIKPKPVEFGLDHPRYSGDNNRTVFYSSPRMKYGGTIDADGSLNWGTVTGEAGYGIRDYSGKIQFKDSGGSWSDIAATADDEGSYVLTSADADLPNSRVLDDDGDYLSLTDDGSKITVAWAKTNNVSIWTNDSGYVTPSSTDTFTNKDGDISQWNNDSGYTANVGTVTPSSSDAFTNKTGNNSMWTNDAGYGTGDGTVTSVSNGDSTISVGGTSAAPTIAVVEANFSGIPNTALTNDGITIGGASTALGGSVSGDTIIGDVSAGGIGNSLLDNDSLTVTAGTGLSGGGVVELGGSVTLNNTEVASVVGGVSAWTSTSQALVLAHDSASALFNFDVDSSGNTDVVSGNASGVYSLADIGWYTVSAYITLAASSLDRNDVGLGIRFVDGSTTDTSFVSTTRKCTTSGDVFEVEGFYEFTDISDPIVRTIEIFILADATGGSTNYDLYTNGEASPMSNFYHRLEITRTA